MEKVLHVVQVMNRGGIENLIMNIYRNIDRDKLQFDFLVHSTEPGDFDDEIKDMGGEIHFVPSRRLGILNNKLAIKDFFKLNSGYKAIHMHVSTLSYITPLILAKKSGIHKRIIHSHSTKAPNNLLHLFLHYLNQFRIKRIANIYFSCSDLASKWLYGEKIEKDKIKIINNAINLNQFSYNKGMQSKYDEFIIGHIGRFVYAKNHEFIIDVFNEIHKLNKNTRLVLVGGGDEEYIKNIKLKVEENKLDSCVEFLGVRSDIPSLLHKMDAFLFPSIYEGLPVTLVEAQAVGLKCFVSDTITRNIDITKNIHYLSLDASPKYWAEEIINKINYKREDMSDKVDKAGFNIENVSRELENFYLRNNELKQSEKING